MEKEEIKEIKEIVKAALTESREEFSAINEAESDELTFDVQKTTNGKYLLRPWNRGPGKANLHVFEDVSEVVRHVAELLVSKFEKSE